MTLWQEKGKYEVVQGQQKEAEGLVDMWHDVVTRYPSVIGLIDPLRKQVYCHIYGNNLHRPVTAKYVKWTPKNILAIDQDKTAWQLLCEKVSQHCLIMGDFVVHRPGLLKDEELSEGVSTSAAIMRLEQVTSVSDVLAAAARLQSSPFPDGNYGTIWFYIVVYKI